MAFDRAIRTSGVLDRDPEPVNRAFDALTMLFFSFRLGEAKQKVDELTATWEKAADADRASLAWLRSLQPTLSPKVMDPEFRGELDLTLQSIYERAVPPPGGDDWRVELRGPDGVSIGAFPLEAAPGSTRVRFARKIPLKPEWLAKRGVWTLTVALPSGGRFEVTRFSVLDQPVTAVRTRLLDRAAKLEGKASGPLGQALAAAKARAELIVEQPSTWISSQFLHDAATMEDAVNAELTALEAGKDPYRDRVGDLWRSFALGSSRITARVRVPSAKAPSEGRPVLIALHGAGGDENMFLDAYGAGLVGDLGEKRNVLVVSPPTGAVGPGNLARFLAALGEAYAIDRNRVYVIGHSMGAGATGSLARGAAKQLAAVCCLAGGGVNYRGIDRPPPALIWAGELDPMFSLKRLESAATAARGTGWPVEFRTAKGHGHTLMVTTVLPEAVDWLLQHRLPR
jgi:predicted esterase